jgi:hypothetical protein
LVYFGKQGTGRFDDFDGVKKMNYRKLLNNMGRVSRSLSVYLCHRYHFSKRLTAFVAMKVLSGQCVVMEQPIFVRIQFRRGLHRDALFGCYHIDSCKGRWIGE